MRYDEASGAREEPGTLTCGADSQVHHHHKTKTVCPNGITNLDKYS
jgi:hypothetical protein